MFKEFLKGSDGTNLNEGYSQSEKNLALYKIQEFLESAPDATIAKVVKTLGIDLYLKGNVEANDSSVKAENVMDVKKVQAGLKKILLNDDISNNVRNLVDKNLKDGYMITGIIDYSRFDDITKRNRAELDIMNKETKETTTFLFT